MTRRTLRVLAAAVSIICTLIAAPGAHAALETHPCVESIMQIECATVEVPLDRTGIVPGSVRLQVIKSFATEGPRLGTMLLVAGGPGQANQMMLWFMLSAFPGANRYDLLVVDQRGTGYSQPLNCPAIERGAKLVGADPTKDLPVTQCADQLGAARTGYDTGETLADIETVRAALGIDRLSIFGVSYGTKVALAYATRYPSNVQSLLLDSVLPVSEPGAFDLESIAAMRSSLDKVCGSGRCKSFLRAPQQGLARLAARLREQPLEGMRLNTETGRPQTVKFGEKELYNLLFAADFNLFIYHQLPSAISSALRGDDAAMLRLGSLIGADGGDRLGTGEARPRRGAKRPARDPFFTHEGSSVSEFSNSLNLATVCEDLATPWTRGTSVNERQPAIDTAANAVADAAFAPFSRTMVKHESLASVCRGWHDSPAETPLASGPLPPVPTLALNGGLDVRTPTSWARSATAGNPAAQVVEIEHTGHSTIGTDLSGCALSLAKRFLTFGTTDGKCRNEPQPIPVAAPAPTSSRFVKPLAGRCEGRARGRRCAPAKRALTAAYGAARDAFDQLLIGGLVGGEGLRGGSWELDIDWESEEFSDEELPISIRLSDVEHVGGVVVSGRLELSRMPRVSADLQVFDMAGGVYSVRLSGNFAYAPRNDRVTLRARVRRGSVTVGRNARRRGGIVAVSSARLRTRSHFAAATLGKPLRLTTR